MKNKLESFFKNYFLAIFIIFSLGFLTAIIMFSYYEVIYSYIIKKINWEYFIAIISIISGIIVVLFTNKMNKRQITSTIITGNRMEWIQKFRQLISAYISQVKFYEDKIIKPNDLEKLFSLESDIKLQLNLFGIYDAIICNYISRLNFSYSSISHLILIMENNSDNVEMSEKETLEMLKYIFKYYNKIPSVIIKKILSDDEKPIIKTEEDLYNFYDKNEEKLHKISCYVFMKFKERWIKDIKYLSDLILIYSQIYLKVEWDRVKKEARNGIQDNFEFDQIFKKYIIKKNEEITKINELLKIDEI